MLSCRLILCVCCMHHALFKYPCFETEGTGANQDKAPGVDLTEGGFPHPRPQAARAGVCAWKLTNSALVLFCFLN